MDGMSTHAKNKIETKRAPFHSPSSWVHFAALIAPAASNSSECAVSYAQNLVSPSMVGIGDAAANAGRVAAPRRTTAAHRTLRTMIN